MHEGYWMLDNKQLLEYIAGKEIAEKYNNIQARLFREENAFSERRFIKSLMDWLF